MKIFFTSIFFAAILSILYSCKNRNTLPGYLQGVDRVSVNFFVKPDTLRSGTSKTGEVEMLTETVADASTQHTRMQDTTGSMWFIRNDTLVLEVYFTSPGTGSKFDAPVFVYRENRDINGGAVIKGGRFTYKAGSLLEEFYSLARSKRK